MKIEIDHEPVPQLRPRATRIGNSIRLYDPKKVSLYKTFVKYAGKQQYKGDLLTSPLSVEIIFYRPIPKSESKKRKLLMESKEILPIVKPDIDNYTKAVLDALNDVVWKDDSQIVELVAKKYYSEKPRTEIYFSEVE